MEVMRYRVKLDMEDSGTLKTQLRLKQGDSAITLVFKIMKNGIDVYSASDVPTVVFKRPDGTSVVGNMSVAEGQYTYTMAGNELQIAGPMTADVKFDVNTARESTCTFGFECVPDTMSPDTNPAGIFVNSLKDIITAVQQGVEKVEQAVEVFDVQQIIDLKNQIEELIEELPDFTIDDEFDTTSEHALQNKVIAEAIDTINDALDSLAAVATSGSYNDLTDKPTIPSAYTLPKASASTLGGVKVGDNLSIDGNGVLSAEAGGDTTVILDTEAEYEALTEAEKLAGSYLIKESNVETIGASVIPYNSEMSVKTKIDALNNSLTQYKDYTITVTGKLEIYPIDIPQTKQIISASLMYLDDYYFMTNAQNIDIPSISFYLIDGTWKLMASCSVVPTSPNNKIKVRVHYV